MAAKSLLEAGAWRLAPGGWGLEAWAWGIEARVFAPAPEPEAEALDLERRVFPQSPAPSPEPLIRYLRYSLFLIRPSSQTTIDATVSLPWIVEISKHSMRRGNAGNASTCCSVSSAVYSAEVVR